MILQVVSFLHPKKCMYCVFVTLYCSTRPFINIYVDLDKNDLWDISWSKCRFGSILYISNVSMCLEYSMNIHAYIY